MARRGYGDEIWRLAGERDVERLRQASAALLDGDHAEFAYDGHRAAAFALALDGSLDEALGQLNAGWSGDWPFPGSYATDVARVRYLAGDPEGALASLALGLRGAERVQLGARELIASCVRARPSLWRSGLKAALAGGTPWDRIPASLAVLRATLAR